MLRRTPGPTRTATPFPYTPPFRSDPAVPVSFAGNHRALARASGGRGADGGRQANKRTPKRSSMARGINKAILVGNLGNDPETKYTQGGMAITKISLATTSVRKDRDGNSQENTRSEEHTSEIQT